MKPIDLRLSSRSVLKVYQLNLVLGDNRPQVKTLVEFGDIECSIV